MKSHNLFNIACKCLTLDELPTRRDILAGMFSSGEVSVERFLMFCDRHWALPPVYRLLRRHALTDLFPRELIRHLEQMYESNKWRNGEILDQVDEFCAELNKAGIAPVYLKGAAHLLDGLYVDRGERLIGDIDVLVEEKDYLNTVEVFKSCGYDLWWRVADIPQPERGGGRATRFHFTPLLRDDRLAAVEVHHKPVPVQFSEDTRTEAIFNEKKEIAGRENCFVPSDKHKIVHNVIHRHLTNPAYKLRPPCLRDVYDLYLLSKREKPGDVLSQIGRKDKASGYFLSVAGALGLEHKFNARENKKAKWHCFVCDLPVKRPRISKVSRKVLFVCRLIFKTYLGNIFKAVFRKSSREHVISRLSDPRWYHSHMGMLKKKLFS